MPGTYHTRCPASFRSNNHAADRDTAVIDDWHELSVANPTFLLERLGSECTDLQGLRELTVNGLDAIAALGDRAGGRVVWDLDWQRFDASGGRVRKLSVTDTGTGMTPEQLRQYINQLASSGREQSAAANFGVGAKIAAGSRNPHGLEYHSWHRGQGALVCFKRHPDGRWGLEPQRWPDGHSDFWRPLDEHEKPWLLRDLDHGTQVVLLGQHQRDDTTQPPTSVTETRRQWITRYLNGRFRRFPEHVEVLVCEPQRHGQPGRLQHIQGEQHHLEQRAIAAGTVRLSDAIARWWVLDEDQRSRRREAGIWASTGHAAAVCDGSSTTSCRKPAAGTGAFRTSASASATNGSILHLEPRVKVGRVESNTARTLLLLDHEPLPWARWGEEFAAAMPEEILRLQERAATVDLLPRREAIRNRVSAILPLYQLSRYRPTGPPTQRQARSNTNRTRNGRTSPQSITPDASTASAPDRPRAPSQAEATSDPTPDMPQTHDSHSEGLAESMVGLPDVAWISARDGSRAPGDLEDQAARYHPGRHELTINADFRAISDLIAHWQARYRGVPGAHAVIDAQVREWCEQILAEVVLAARNSSWSHEQLHALLSPTSFTAALLPRHLLHATLQKRLGQKLGTPRSMAEEPASVDMGPCHSPRPRDRGDTTQPGDEPPERPLGTGCPRERAATRGETWTEACP